MSTIDQIQKSAKFGAAVTDGYHRVFVKVAGSNSSWTTWTPSGVEQNVEAALNQNGIGFESVHDVHAIGINPFYFEFTVTVIAPNSQSNAEVENLVRQSVSSVLNGVQVTTISSETANDWSLNNLIPTSTTAIAGLSVTTMVLLGVGLIAIFALKNSPTSPIRYFRR